MKNVIEKIVLGTYLPNGVFTAPGNLILAIAFSQRRGHSQPTMAFDEDPGATS